MINKVTQTKRINRVTCCLWNTSYSSWLNQWLEADFGLLLTHAQTTHPIQTYGFSLIENDRVTETAQFRPSFCFFQSLWLSSIPINELADSSHIQVYPILRAPIPTCLVRTGESVCVCVWTCHIISFFICFQSDSRHPQLHRSTQGQTLITDSGDFFHWGFNDV